MTKSKKPATIAARTTPQNTAPGQEISIINFAMTVVKTPAVAPAATLAIAPWKFSTGSAITISLLLAVPLSTLFVAVHCHL
jgi:hypothetical protein